MPVFLIPVLGTVLTAVGVTGGPIALGGAAAGFSALTGTVATVLAYAVTTGAPVGSSKVLA